MELLSNPPVSYPVLLLVGIGLRLFVSMRRFNRRGLGGLQHFPNYFAALITLFMERIVYLLANGCILWGLVGMLFL
ncbi:hypothetical protein [Sinomicrobium oceani]|uniref:hypothetical protein n=1 Tax=Sinomicrobium oceani TaxID=1150368 RepID=UPI00227CD206|nr:hypothetical protein [Sinomicrobium oceani]